MNSIINKSFFS